MNMQRNLIIEKIWDMYLRADAEVLLAEAEEKLWVQLGYNKDGSKPLPKAQPINQGVKP